MKAKPTTSYGRAKHKVDLIKNFYKHALIFIIVGTVIILSRTKILDFFSARTSHENFIEWIDWNIIINLGIWAVVLAIHALWVFNSKISFLKTWEEKKINEYMMEESKKIERL